MPHLPSLKISGVAIKTDGQAITIQSHSAPSVNLLKADVATNTVTINGLLTATSVGGAIGSGGGGSLTTEVLGNGSTVLALDKNITIFNNTDTSTVSLADGTDGQVKYIGRANNGSGVVNITGPGGGSLLGGHTLRLNSTNYSAVTLVFTMSLGHWSIIGANAITITGGA